MKGWLPHPFMSLLLAALWLLLTQSLVPGNVVLAALFALVLPRLTSGLWPERPRLRHPLVLARFLVSVGFDILLANIAVARLILGPVHRLRPAFVRLPVALTDELAITVLANVISLTPGTVSVDVSDDKQWLLIHTLDLEDEARLIAEIKTRYEAPLKEVFEC